MFNLSFSCSPLYGHKLRLCFLPAKVYHNLFGLRGVQLYMVGPTSPHKVLNQASVLPLLSIFDTANNHSVV